MQKWQKFAASLPKRIAQTGKWFYSMTPNRVAKECGVSEAEVPQLIPKIVEYATKKCKTKRPVRCKVTNRDGTPVRYTFYFYTSGWLGETMQKAADYIPLAIKLYSYIYPNSKPRIQTLVAWAGKLKKSPYDEQTLTDIIKWLHSTSNPYIPSFWDIDSFLKKLPAIIKARERDILREQGLNLSPNEKITKVTKDKIITTNRVVTIKGDVDEQSRGNNNDSEESWGAEKVYEVQL